MWQKIANILPKNPWYYVGVTVILTQPFTFLMNYVQSQIWYGKTEWSLLMIGVIDALVVSLIVSPFIIYFVIHERKKAEARLLELSITDELTGLRNRRGFFALAEQQLKLARRAKETIYLLYADVDDFKSINDRFGHDEGDRLLSDIAATMVDCYRESDVISRFGGDEFVVLPVGTSAEGVDIIINRFNRAFDQLQSDGRGYRVSVSFGLARFDPARPCSLDDLISVADSSMYKQKQSKKPQGGPAGGAAVGLSY